MANQRTPIVIESPLKGDVRENLRYLLWCCRATYEMGYAPIASHLVCPWFMDDAVEEERADGICWPWMWREGVEHWFFTDRGFSPGMMAAMEDAQDTGRVKVVTLEEWPELWEKWSWGGWPPHTEGFVVGE